MASPSSKGGPVSLFRKAPKPSAPIEPTKFTRFSTGEVMDVIETSLMGAQQSYDALRRSPSEQRGFYLHELSVQLLQASTGAYELQAREADL